MQQIIKRDGRMVDFDKYRIGNAITKSMMETKKGIDLSIVNSVTNFIESKLEHDYQKRVYSVEEIQDLVEEELMRSGRCDVAKKYILYREERNKKRNTPMWEMTDIQKAIWENKYKVDDESFEEFLNRVSNGNQEVNKYMIHKKFIPAGRILAGRGLHEKGKKITLSNCFVLEEPQDNIESIFDTAKKMARTYSWGGGVGIDISKLRPINSKVNNAARYTTGSISFMELYSLTTEVISQKGRRK